MQDSIIANIEQELSYRLTIFNTFKMLTKENIEESVKKISEILLENPKIRVEFFTELYKI